MEKMFIYAIHEGCQWEGGHISEIYGSEEKAIKFALMKVEEEKKEDERMNKETWDSYEPWRKIEVESNDFFIMGWQNKFNEICIYKYEVL